MILAYCNEISLQDCECKECTPTGWHGDNYCDDDLNTESCKWDGGDCCGDVNTNYCSVSIH